MENQLENIQKNRELILRDIKKAHKNSIFVKTNLTKLVAVSKKQVEYKIFQAIESGQKVYGENRVQEAQKRWERILETHKDIELRLIGPLQTNKVKQALKLFNII